MRLHEMVEQMPNKLEVFVRRKSWLEHLVICCRNSEFFINTYRNYEFRVEDFLADDWEFVV